MKYVKTFETWNPGEKYMQDILIDKGGLSDESTIKQFIEYNGINTTVFDIWNYAKTEFNAYPDKITRRGMEYYSKGKGTTKVELEFRGDNVTLYHIQIDIVGGKFDNKLIKSDKFSYDLFKKMMTNEVR